jgi:hypothetical protein
VAADAIKQKESKMDRSKIELTDDVNGHRLRCVCGDFTQKLAIYAQSPDGAIRVCEACLKEPDRMDERLKAHAAELREYADEIEGLVGRLDLPSHEAWQAAVDRYEAEWDEQAEQDGAGDQT